MKNSKQSNLDMFNKGPQGWKALLRLTPLGRNPPALGDGKFVIGDHRFSLDPRLNSAGKLPVWIEANRGKERFRQYARIDEKNAFSGVFGGGDGRTGVIQTASEHAYGYRLATSSEPNVTRAMFEFCHAEIARLAPGIAAHFGARVSLGALGPHAAMDGAVDGLFQWEEAPDEEVIACAVALIVLVYNVFVAAVLTWEREGRIGGDVLPPVQLPTRDGDEHKAAA